MTESMFSATTADQFSFPEGEKPNFLAQLLQRTSLRKRSPIVEENTTLIPVPCAVVETEDIMPQAVQDDGREIFRRDLGLISNNLTMISDVMGDSASQLDTATGVSATQIQAMSNDFSMTAEHMQQTMRQVSESTARSMADVNEQLHATREKTHEAAYLGLESREKIEAMVKSSGDIGNVVHLIHGIAEQTRMLAMNATIESVRAGEAGTGFRVIANEVKTLAARTAAATQDISAAVQDIREHSHGAANATLAIVESVEHINNLADNTTRIVDEVTEHITHEISKANDDLQNISKGIDGSFECADDTRVIAQKMNQEACNLRSSIDELGQLTMTHLGTFQATDEDGLVELF